MMRFVFGDHIVRNGQQVIEVFEGDNFVAAIYPAEHAVKIVSSHFDVERTTMDEDYPPTITVRFAGSTPPGRERLEREPVIGWEYEDD